MAKQSDKSKPIVAFKGFNADLSCNGYSFKVGETFTHPGKVQACSSGFHACENPLDVWSYYGLENGNRFCRVHLSGATDRHEGDSKIAAETIFIETEVTLGEMIKAGIAQAFAAVKAGERVDAGHHSKLAASGDHSKLAASGYSSQLAASGYSSKLVASGDSSKLAASGDSSKLAASGDSSQLAASGYSSKLEITGAKSAAVVVGNGSSIKAVKGTPVAICEYDRNGNPKGFVTGIAGKDCPADTWLIAKGGKLVAA